MGSVPSQTLLVYEAKEKETLGATNLDISCTFDLTSIAHSKQMADENQQTLIKSRKQEQTWR